MVENTIISPSGRHKLVITRSPHKLHSRGKLYTIDDVADVKRNYGIFNHSFQIKNGQEFLITGRNYMGQTIINCDEKWEVSTPDKYTGYEFCWYDHWLSPDGNTLAVDGCCWGCPYQLKF